MDARFQSAFSAGKDTSSRDSCFLGKEKKERCKKSGIRSLATFPFEVDVRNYFFVFLAAAASFNSLFLAANLARNFSTRPASTIRV